MAATCQSALVDSLYVVTYHLIPSKFYTHYFNQTLIKLKYGFCQTNDNKPPYLLLDCYQISYMDYFNQTNIGFVW